MIELEFKEDLHRIISYIDRFDSALQRIEEELPAEFAEYVAAEMRKYIHGGGTTGKTGGGPFAPTSNYWADFMGKSNVTALIRTGEGVKNILAEGRPGEGEVKAPDYMAAFSPSSGFENLEIRERFLVDENGVKVKPSQEAAVSARIKRTKVYDLDDPTESRRFWKRRYKSGFTQPVWVTKTIKRYPRDWARIFPEDYAWCARRVEQMIDRFMSRSGMMLAEAPLSEFFFIG